MCADMRKRTRARLATDLWLNGCGEVLVVLGWPKDGTLLHALDLETGAQLWNTSAGGTMGSPLIAHTRRKSKTRQTNKSTTQSKRDTVVFVLASPRGAHVWRGERTQIGRDSRKHLNAAEIRK